MNALVEDIFTFKVNYVGLAAKILLYGIRRELKEICHRRYKTAPACCAVNYQKSRHVLACRLQCAEPAELDGGRVTHAFCHMPVDRLVN